MDDYREVIRKLIEDDIRNDVEEEMRKAANELMGERRQAIKQVLEEQRKVVKEVVEEEKKAIWARLEDLRDSISNYNLTSWVKPTTPTLAPNSEEAASSSTTANGIGLN